MCPSEHEAVIKLELNGNCSSPTLPTSSETYAYPKGKHNGAVGPKYASKTKRYKKANSLVNSTWKKSC